MLEPVRTAIDNVRRQYKISLSIIILVTTIDKRDTIRRGEYFL